MFLSGVKSGELSLSPSSGSSPSCTCYCSGYFSVLS
nr:MAG TPA: hypothetical protein [Caudoviricetes sp.]